MSSIQCGTCGGTAFWLSLEPETGQTSLRCKLHVTHLEDHHAPTTILGLTVADFDDAIACLDACSADPREPSRYRQREPVGFLPDFAKVADKFRTTRGYMLGMLGDEPPAASGQG